MESVSAFLTVLGILVGWPAVNLGGGVASGCACATPPTVRAVGTTDQNALAIAPGIPAGTVAGDLLIMALETATAQAITVSGWTEAPGSPVLHATGPRLTVMYRIATGTDATTTSDSGDHQRGRIIGITTGTFDPSSPFHVNTTNTQDAVTAVSISGTTTTKNNCLIIAISAGNLPDASSSTEFSSAANANLVSTTERIDNTGTAGTGGALFAATGAFTTAGNYGATTATAANAADRANLSMAIAPL